MLPPYNMLDRSAIEQIHDAALTVLETTGLCVDHPVAQEKMAAAGAIVDKGKKTIKIPPRLVEKALETVPRGYTLAGRSPEFDSTVGVAGTHAPLFRSIAGPIRYHDYLSGENRMLSTQDCRDVARLVDSLENIDWLGTLTPHDMLPANTYDVHILRDMIECCRKHIWALTIDSRNLRYQLEIMEAIAGGRRNMLERPPCTGIVTLIEPYYIPHDEIERLLLYGEYNLPALVPLTPIAGANAPYTLAGTVAHTTAEFLGSLALMQTLCPGMRTLFYFFIQTLEMRQGFTEFFNPETLLASSALCRMGAHYNVPVKSSSVMGNGCESNQVLFERGVSLTMTGLSGTSVIGGAGGLESGLFISPLALTIDDELMAFDRRLGCGFPIDEKTIGVEAIQRVGHNGNYISDDHTFDHLHRELRFAPKLFDWRPYADWRSDGRTFIQRGRERLDSLLHHHEVPPFEEGLQRELDRIVKAADKELAGV